MQKNHQKIKGLKLIYMVVILLSCYILLSCSSKTGNKHMVLYLKAEENATSQHIDEACNIIKQRLINYCIHEEDIKISIQNKNILLEIGHVDNPERIKSLVIIPGEIGFWETYELKDIFNYLDKANKWAADKFDSIISSEKNSKKIVKPEKDSSSLFSNIESSEDYKNKVNEQFIKENPLFAYLKPATTQTEGGVVSFTNGPEVGYCEITDTSKVNNILNMAEIQMLFPYNLKFLWAKPEVRQEKTYLTLIALKMSNRINSAPLDGSMIADAKAKKNKMGSYEILVTMTNEGAKIWERITANNLDRSIAIVLDNTVYSYPVVRSKISEGNSVISGNFTIEQAEDLATILKFHSLPVRLSISDCKVTDVVK